MAANQQMIVAGEQIPVLQVADAALFQRMTAAQMTDLLGWAGYVGDQIVAETIQAMTENGYDLPRAWAEVRSPRTNWKRLSRPYEPVHSGDRHWPGVRTRGHEQTRSTRRCPSDPTAPHNTLNSWRADCIRGGLIALGTGWLHEGRAEWIRVGLRAWGTSCGVVWCTPTVTHAHWRSSLMFTGVYGKL